MSPYSRPPTSREAYAAGVESELAEERAQTLGRAGRGVEQAMEALRAFDEAGGGEGREVLLKKAADAFWRYSVQREAGGFRDQREAIQIYGITREILIRMGAR